MKWRCYNRFLWFEIERNLSPPDAFYGIFIFYVQNPFAAGAPPRTPLGELTALSHTPSWWGGGLLPPPQEPHPRSRPFGPRPSALEASSLAPQTQKPNFAHGRWEICRTNQNTAATALSDKIRQTVPDASSGDRKSSVTDGRQSGAP